jgi:two-component system response regulator DegU
MMRVLVISDNQIFLELFSQYLSSLPEISIVGKSHPNEITQTHCLNQPDIILFLHGCDTSGLKREFSNIKRSFPNSKIIFVSPRNDREYMEFNIIKIGAKSFVCAEDSLKTLVKAIKTCYSGEIWATRKTTNKIIKDLEDKMPIKKEVVAGLTDQEKRVLLFLTSGLKNTEIAQRLFVSEKTVKAHLNKIFKKIQVSNRLQAALWTSKNLIQK